MKIEIKEKWVNALRSGEYQQGKGGLLCEGKYCCLGVLSDLYAKEHNIEWKEEEYSKFKSLLDSDKILPIEIRKWAELEEENPYVFNDYHQTLAELNDNGLSFIGIADLIEKQL